MKTDKTSVIVIDEQNEQNSNLPINNSQSNKKSADSIAQDQFFKMIQLFGLEAAVIPVEKQMPVEDRSIKREKISKQLWKKHLHFVQTIPLIKEQI